MVGIVIIVLSGLERKRDCRLTFLCFVSIGGWIDGLSRKSEDGLAKYLQMAEPSSCRTYQWMQVRELALHFSQCFELTR